VIVKISESDFVGSDFDVTVSVGRLLGAVGTEAGGAYKTCGLLGLLLNLPHVLWQSMPLTVRVQVSPDGSFCTLAEKKMLELPATTLLILFWMTTEIGGLLMAKLSESDLEPSCTDVAVSVA
jgi:hypothetical protein